MSYRSTSQRLYTSAKHVIYPDLRPAAYSWADRVAEWVRDGTRWLDLGCGKTILYESLSELERSLVARCRHVVGVDSNMPTLRQNRALARVCGDIARLPFADRSFDLVTANMVVEHLATPAEQFAEIRRVLDTGGVFLFHTPNVWGHPTIMARMIPERVKPSLVWLLQRRKAEDVFPTHYLANSPSKIRELARESGFEPVAEQCLSTDAQTSKVIPLFVPELVWMRLLRARPLNGLRSNLIVALRRVD